ncbi:MAG: TSUP family transporter [Actinobacteria bacterium]|nr:TSUP family transporter [Actinomycetota bacterium]
MTVALVLSMMLVAALVRSVFGFGDSLLAMPVLTLALGIKTAAPLIGLTSLALATAMLLVSRRAVDLRATKQLLPWIVLGIPVGIVALIKAPQGPVSLALGVSLIAYGLYALTGPRLPEVRSAAWVAPVGLLSGALGGAFNTNGPPIVVYGSLKRWPPEVYRATLQANFLTAAFFIALGHGLGGLWTERVLALFLATVPALIAGFWLGRVVSRRIPAARFAGALMTLIVSLGVMLTVEGVRVW